MQIFNAQKSSSVSLNSDFLRILQADWTGERVGLITWKPMVRKETEQQRNFVTEGHVIINKIFATIHAKKNKKSKFAFYGPLLA